MMLLTTIVLSVMGMASASCSVSSPVAKVDANDPVAYKDTCIIALEKQVRIEFEAALQYILMAAHFDQDTVNLPNIAPCSGPTLTRKGHTPLSSSITSG